MRKRAGALYIRDKKLLLISEGGQDLYWTPGGGLEAGETFIEALERELMEELGARLLRAKSFLTIHDEKADEDVEYFLVNMQLPEAQMDGTNIYWYAKEDFVADTLTISQRIHQVVFPKLLAEGIV